MSSPPPPSKDKDTVGTLVVVVLKARNLKDKHTFSKQDPFTTVRLGKLSKSTKVDVRGGQHPVWDEDLHLPVHVNASKSNRTLTVQCFAKESREDDLLGEGTVDIEETLKTGEFDDWVKLEQDGSYQGEVYLEMTYFPANAPRPISQPIINAPAMPNSPASSGSSPKAKQSLLPPPSLMPASGLYRRPSKLPSHERLWRPPQSQNYKTSPLGSPGVGPQTDGYGVPSQGSSRHTSNSPSPGRRDDRLPPLPPLEESRSSKLIPVPSVLRPGNAKSSPQPLPDTSNRPYTQSGEQASYARPNSTAPLRIPEPTFGPATPNHGGYGYDAGYGGSAGGYPGQASLPDPYSRATQQSYARTNYTPAQSSPPREYGSYPIPSQPLASPHYASYTSQHRNPLGDTSPLYAQSQPQPSPRPRSTHTTPPSHASEPRPRPQPAYNHRSQEDADAALAAQLAREEGIDVERLRAQEADEAFARQLAREINSDVVALREGSG